MKIWILNNTKFDTKNIKSFEYFEEVLIPHIQKYSKDGDVIVHLGNVFNNSDVVQTTTLNKTLSLINTMALIRPIYFLDGYDTELLKLIKSVKNTHIVDTPIVLDGVKLIPKNNVIKHISVDDDIVFINSKIDSEYLLKYDAKFYCGGTDKKTIVENVVHVGSPYQFDIKSSAGFYIVDSKSKKHKYIKNDFNLKYETILITDINQLDELDKEYVSKNNVSVEIDKVLVDEKKIKIDVLLNYFDFKNIKYINDDDGADELIDNSSINMENILLEKIKNSDNKELLSEF